MPPGGLCEAFWRAEPDCWLVCFRFSLKIQFFLWWHCKNALFTAPSDSEGGASIALQRSSCNLLSFYGGIIANDAFWPHRAIAREVCMWMVSLYCTEYRFDFESALLNSIVLDLSSSRDSNRGFIVHTNDLP